MRPGNIVAFPDELFATLGSCRLVNSLGHAVRALTWQAVDKKPATMQRGLISYFFIMHP
jgi:hypothetical protein